MYSMPVEYLSLFLCTYMLSVVPYFSRFEYICADLSIIFQYIKGTYIVDWFQYTNTIYRAEYCTTSNFNITGFRLLHIFLHKHRNDPCIELRIHVDAISVYDFVYRILGSG